ncbi:hypothetical protein [Bradyrhizobium uaiense]|nr:hypothetical protein [Bradyrhizobium uaiense]
MTPSFAGLVDPAAEAFKGFTRRGGYAKIDRLSGLSTGISGRHFDFTQ